jgi:transcriptional antiterminator RfaH
MLAEKSGVALRAATATPSSGIGREINDRSAGQRWYVVQTQPRAQSRAISHLEWQAYNVFCPRYRKTVRHARKVTSVLAPLIQNYLFLHLDASRHPWRAINRTRGVARLISQGELPAPLPHGVVEDLLAKTNAYGAMEWKPTFKIGQAVRIADGPFADFVGTLEHLDAAGRVRVLLDLLGRSVSVALRCEALMAAA